MLCKKSQKEYYIWNISNLHSKFAYLNLIVVQ